MLQKPLFPLFSLFLQQDMYCSAAPAEKLTIFQNVAGRQDSYLVRADPSAQPAIAAEEDPGCEAALAEAAIAKQWELTVFLS